MSRFTNYLRSLAAQMTSPKPFKLSPGQYETLCRETGNPRVKHFETPLGVHEVVRIHTTTRAVGDNVILAPREDLFIESENPEGVRLVSVANSVTSVPDNIAAVEVISVGELVQGFEPGDIVFIDFFQVKQGYAVENDDLYMAGADAFAAKFDLSTQEVEPLDNFVTTRRAHDRMKVAINGATQAQYTLDSRLTEGVVSGRTSKGSEALHTVFEEVVKVGRLTNRPRPGVLTPTERKVLEMVLRGERHFELIENLRREREEGRPSDIQPGDLVAFCKEIATQLRVRGEFRSLIPYDNVLAVIDDEAIRAKARAADLAKPRILLAGGS